MSSSTSLPHRRPACRNDFASSSIEVIDRHRQWDSFYQRPTTYFPAEDRPLSGRATYDLSFVDPDHDWDFNEERQEEILSDLMDDVASFFDVSDESEWTYERLLALDERIERVGGLPVRIYRSFQTFVMRDTSSQRKERKESSSSAYFQRDDDVGCPVCQEGFDLGQTIVVLPCQHCFHDECIQRWFVSHSTCPVCRFECNDGKDVSADGEQEERELNVEGNDW